MPRRPRARRRGARRSLPPPPPPPGPPGPGPDDTAPRMSRSGAAAGAGTPAPRFAAELVVAEMRRIALIGGVCSVLLAAIVVADRLR